MAFSPAFFDLYADLPRQGVGTDWCTHEAVRRLPPLRKPPTILDLGCGSGRQTLILARHFRSRIEAVDLCPLFLEQLEEAAKAIGVESFIHPRRENFTRLTDSPASYDLVWSEGGVGVLGLRRALELWAPLLRTRGVLAVSDCIWLTAQPPAAARDFWERTHPQMTDLAGALDLARRAGLVVFDHFLLPRAAWWDEYYSPLSRRMSALRDRAAEDPELAQVIAQARDEITLFERYGESYGYVFYLMRLA